MKSHGDSKTIILFALSANLFIAVIKFIAAFISSSSAMLAEAVHSSADTVNQIFLLIGLKKGKKEADVLHPFGYSREIYFWSFLVAMVLFILGAVFNIYEGIEKISHPHDVDNYTLLFIVFILSAMAEFTALRKAYKKIIEQKGDLGIYKFLRKTKNSELMVVFLEDTAAILGLICALVLIVIQYFTGLLFLDGVASIIIGIILAFVACFLSVEIKSLLVGESADKELLQSISDIFYSAEESVTHLINLQSLQMGPNDVLIAAKVEFNSQLNNVEISNIINGLESDIRSKFPIVKKIFIEPDIKR